MKKLVPCASPEVAQSCRLMTNHCLLVRQTMSLRRRPHFCPQSQCLQLIGKLFASCSMILYRLSIGWVKYDLRHHHFLNNLASITGSKASSWHSKSTAGHQLVSCQKRAQQMMSLSCLEWWSQRTLYWAIEVSYREIEVRTADRRSLNYGVYRQSSAAGLLIVLVVHFLWRLRCFLVSTGCA